MTSVYESNSFNLIYNIFVFDFAPQLHFKHRNVPTYIIRILICWYRNQQMYVKWGQTISASFTVTHVTAGWHPIFLICIVMTYAYPFNNFNIGCRVNNTTVNHILYADDLVLISPSTKGLATLLRVCEKYRVQHDILYLIILSLQ